MDAIGGCVKKLASDDPDLWIVFMNFDVKKRAPHSQCQSDVGPRNSGGYYGPSRNFASMKENNDGFSWSITAPETMMNDDVDEMSMKIPVMGIIKMMVICVLLSMERISLQEISGSSTSMMEEKTMDIKDIFARHGFSLCPLTNADANKLKLDFDELRDSVASQSVAVAGDGGGSVLCVTLCAGKIQQNVDLISSGAKKPKVLCGGPTSSGGSKSHSLNSRSSVGPVGNQR